jgi:predicted nucleotidyltransferase
MCDRDIDLSAEQVSEIKQWARETPQAREVRLFGSRAKGASTRKAMLI